MLERGGGDVEIAKLLFWEKNCTFLYCIYLVRKDVDTLDITSFPKGKIRVQTGTCYVFTNTTPV